MLVSDHRSDGDDACMQVLSRLHMRQIASWQQQLPRRVLRAADANRSAAGSASSYSAPQGAPLPAKLASGALLDLHDLGNKSLANSTAGPLLLSSDQSAPAPAAAPAPAPSGAVSLATVRPPLGQVVAAMSGLQACICSPKALVL